MCAYGGKYMGKIEIKHLIFGYDNQLMPIFEDVNLTIDEFWKLGLIGRNGRKSACILCFAGVGRF